MGNVDVWREWRRMRCGMLVALYLGIVCSELFQKVRAECMHAGSGRNAHSGKCICEELRVGRSPCVQGSVHKCMT